MTHIAPTGSLARYPIARHPIYVTLSSFPTVCFTLTLLTDIAYWRTSNLMWQHFSEWLLLAGLVFGALAVLIGIVEFIARSEIRASRPAWLHAVGFVVALVLALVNSLVHAGDGWTGVVPYGLVLSVITLIVILIADWFGRDAMVHHSLGASKHARPF